MPAIRWTGEAGQSMVASPMRTLALLVAFTLLQTMNTHAQSIENIAVKDIDQKATTLGAHKGKVRLVVNVLRSAATPSNTPAWKPFMKNTRTRGWSS